MVTVIPTSILTGIIYKQRQISVKSKSGDWSVEYAALDEKLPVASSGGSSDSMSGCETGSFLAKKQFRIR